MAGTGEVRAAGEQALSSLRRTLEQKAADLIRRDPERAAHAVEVGLVDRDWLERPGTQPIRSVTTIEMMQRFLERSVEQRPSVLGNLGLNTLQVLSWSASDDSSDANASPVVVVFTDLENFTAYTSANGDDAAIALLAELHRVVGPVVRGRGGRVVKRLGDGLMLSFPAPEAAVLAAVELVEVSPEPLRMRAGVHIGDAVVSRDDLIGHVVNVAARVTEAAKGGQVLVTTDVRAAVGDLSRVTFGRARRVRLKGVPEAIRVCVVESG
ncbi:MAG: adenylate/guanylate cyclase domain-containing protein [Acidimicrobiales bacterium]